MWKVIGALITVGSLIMAGWLLDDRYAKADDVKNEINKNQLEIQINTAKDEIRWYQDQMSYIMSRCNKNDPKDLPEHAFKSYNEYLNKKEFIDKELKTLFERRK